MRAIFTICVHESPPGLRLFEKLATPLISIESSRLPGHKLRRLGLSRLIQTIISKQGCMDYEAPPCILVLAKQREVFKKRLGALSTLSKT